MGSSPDQQLRAGKLSLNEEAGSSCVFGCVTNVLGPFSGGRRESLAAVVGAHNVLNVSKQQRISRSLIEVVPQVK